MSFYDKITELQIEHTSICNASCPMCIREITPDKSWFNESYLESNFYVDNIPQSVLDGLTEVNFNGVIGDPCCAPNLIETVSTFIEKSHAYITVSTNGGMKNVDFWKELATTLGDRGRVIFGIDGLEDTNDIYRVNVRYSKLMDNVRAFIDNNGHAVWQYISFRHNEHQVEQARQLSESMGFKSFYVKPSYRFILDDMMGVTRYGKNNTLLEPPSSVVYLHPLVKQRHKFSMDEWVQSTNNSKIDCFAQHNNSIYIDYQGNLFPCCPLSAGMMARRVVNFTDGWNQLWSEHGGTHINLRSNDFDSILNGPFFTEVKDRWTKDYNNGRLASCAGTCSDSTLKFNHRSIDGSNKST